MYGDDNSLSVTAVGEKPGTGCHDEFSKTSLEAVTENFKRDRAAVKWGTTVGGSVVHTDNGRNLVKSIPVESELFCT